MLSVPRAGWPTTIHHSLSAGDQVDSVPTPQTLSDHDEGPVRGVARVRSDFAPDGRQRRAREDARLDQGMLVRGMAVVVAQGRGQPGERCDILSGRSLRFDGSRKSPPPIFNVNKMDPTLEELEHQSLSEDDNPGGPTLRHRCL